MYNLIVTIKGWSGSRDTINKSRVFEYTAEELKARFKPKDVLDIPALIQLPTLFVPEVGSGTDQVAHAGRILRIREVGSDYEITYAFDTSVAPILSAKIDKLASDLDIGDWELSRTHWAVKDVDLFYVLMKEKVSHLAPRVFNIGSQPTNKRLISVMMPFDASFDQVYAAIKEAIENQGRQCHRADDIWKHDAVIQDIVELIETSAIVICDMSGRNPNVFYEAGIAHTFGKDVILVAQSKDDVPFNLRHLRYVEYLNNNEGRAKLVKQICDRVETLSRT